MLYYCDVIMGTTASQITSLTIVYLTVYSGTDQRKHQNSASLAFVRGFHRWPVISPHKGPVTRKLFPFDDVIMSWSHWGPLACVCNSKICLLHLTACRLLTPSHCMNQCSVIVDLHQNTQELHPENFIWSCHLQFIDDFVPVSIPFIMPIS